MGVEVPHNRDDYIRQVRQQGNKFTHLSKLENPRSGSDWNYADLLTFRVLLKESTFAKSDKEYPSFLNTHIKEARKRLGVSDDFQSLATILRGKKWNSSPRAEVRRGKEFGSFLGFLDEAVEQEPLSRPPIASDREPRNTKPVQYALLPDEEGELSSSDSSHTSDVSHEDQTTINKQIKSELLVNSLIIQYLQLLELYISDPKDQRKPRLEWSMKQENFEFQVPNSATLSTRNDGGLIYRHCANGKWARARPLSCYCSVEAKSAFHIEGKKIETYAQESSQIIGMIHQRERNARELGPEARVHSAHWVVPLISISQYWVWVTIVEYSQEYYDFLCTGDDSGEPFLTLKQYGPHKLTNDSQFLELSRRIVALMLYLEEAGQHRGLSEL